MKIQFDSNQDYQLDAIKAVVDVFDGQSTVRPVRESTVQGATAQGRELRDSILAPR